MRIISQAGDRDFNYKNIDLNIVKSGVEEVSILCNTPCLLNVKMAQYSTREKAEKAMNQLHDVYCGNECFIWKFPREDEV